MNKAQIKVTRTSIKKHSIDVPKDVQEFLRSSGFHDFDKQIVGDIVKIPAKALPTGNSIELSFQRPRTHDGKFRRLGLSITLVNELSLEPESSFEFIKDEEGTLCIKIVDVGAELSLNPKKDDQNHLENDVGVTPSQSTESNIKFPDRFLDWQSSKPGAVRRPFSDRNSRPLGPEIVLETVLVRRLQTLSEHLTSSSRSEDWVKPRGIFLVGGAGNGKSDALESFLHHLAEKTKDSQKSLSNLSGKFGQNKRRITIDISVDLLGLDIGFKKIEIIQDATEGDGSSKGAGELLLADLAMVDDKDVLLICCINRGILEAARLAAFQNKNQVDSMSAQLKFLKICTELIDPHAFGQKCWPSEEGYYIWPLDIETLVEDNDIPVFQQLLEFCIDEETRWSKDCLDLGDSSAIAYNRSILLDRDAKENLCELLSDYEILSGAKWTFRELFSLISHILTGGGLRLNDVKPSALAKELMLPAPNSTPKKLIESTCDTLRATLPQLLFPNWPNTDEFNAAVKELAKKAPDGGLKLLKNFCSYLRKRKNTKAKLPVEQTLRGDWSSQLDPILGMDFELHGEDSFISEREIEDAFGINIRTGIEAVESVWPNLFGEIERSFLELLSKIETEELRALLDQNASPLIQEKTKLVKSWLRQLSLSVVKRFLGVRFSQGYESEKIRFFKRHLNDRSLLKEIKNSFARILGEGNDDFLRVELNLGLCQPRGLFINDGILLEAQIPDVDFEIIKQIEERPGGDAVQFRFNYGLNKSVAIPFSFELFKQISAQRWKLIPSCLDPMTVGFMERFRMNLDGQAVRSWNSPHGRIKIVAKGAETETIFKGKYKDFEEGVGDE